MNPYAVPEPAPEPAEESMPCCPICGEESWTFYEDSAGTLVGCDNCIRPVSPRELEVTGWTGA